MYFYLIKYLELLPLHCGLCDSTICLLIMNGNVMRMSWNMKPQSAVVLLSNQASLCTNTYRTLPLTLPFYSQHPLLPSRLTLSDATWQHKNKERDDCASHEPAYLSVLQDAPTETIKFQFLLMYSHIQAIQCRNIAAAHERSVGDKRPTTACVKRPCQRGWYISASYPFPSWSLCVCVSTITCLSVHLCDVLMWVVEAEDWT